MPYIFVSIMKKICYISNFHGSKESVALTIQIS